MASPNVSKTIRFSPDLYYEAEAVMRETGLEDFSEFVRRAVKTEIRITELRDQHLQQLAAEDPNDYGDPEAAALEQIPTKPDRKAK